MNNYQKAFDQQFEKSLEKIAILQEQLKKINEKLTKCCNAPAKMTNHEKGIQSNVQFMVCSECGKGDLWRVEGIEIEDILNNK